MGCFQVNELVRFALREAKSLFCISRPDASSKFKRSETIGAEEEGGVKMVDSRPVRRSDTAYVLEDQASPKIMESIERMHQVARLPLEYGEELQVTRYSKGDYYQFHWDSQ